MNGLFRHLFPSLVARRYTTAHSISLVIPYHISMMTDSGRQLIDRCHTNCNAVFTDKAQVEGQCQKLDVLPLADHGAEPIVPTPSSFSSLRPQIRLAGHAQGEIGRAHV